MMASIMGLFGFPITVGSLFPLKANTRGYDIAPEPGKVVPCVGNVLSWLVRRKCTLGSSRR